MNHNSSHIPVHEVHRGMFNTAGGSVISLIDPAPLSIHIEDIAHALAHVCRFGGHCSTFYSVAQHCVLAAHIVPQTAKKWALLHDAPEAYLGDVIKPLKVLLGATYGTLEANFEKAIQQRFQVWPTEDTKQVVKAADLLLLESEHEALQQGKPARLLDLLNMLPYENARWAWHPEQAKANFLHTYKTLFECKS